MIRQAILDRLLDPNAACRSWAIDELAVAVQATEETIGDVLRHMVTAGEVVESNGEYEAAPQPEVKRPRQMSLLD